MSLRNTVRSYCVICKRDFPCSARLTRHWNSVHTGKRRRFITETKFNKLVPNSKKRCDICNIIFYSDFSKKRHDRWHSKNKLACEVATDQDEIVAEIDEIVKKLNAVEANAEVVEPEAVAEIVAEPIAEPAEVVAKKESNKKVKKVITNPSAETVDTAAEKPTEAPARKARDVEKTVKSVKKSTKHNVGTTEIVEKAAAKKESARKKATVAKENDRKVEKEAEQHYELRISHFPFFFGWCDVASSDSCLASEKTV